MCLYHKTRDQVVYVLLLGCNIFCVYTACGHLSNFVLQRGVDVVKVEGDPPPYCKSPVYSFVFYTLVFVFAFVFGVDVGSGGEDPPLIGAVLMVSPPPPQHLTAPTRCQIMMTINPLH